MELRTYLASIAGLAFIYIILWYLTVNAWMPSNVLGPIGVLLGLCALVATGTFVVEAIRESGHQ